MVTCTVQWATASSTVKLRLIAPTCLSQHRTPATLMDYTVINTMRILKSAVYTTMKTSLQMFVAVPVVVASLDFWSRWIRHPLPGKSTAASAGTLHHLFHNNLYKFFSVLIAMGRR